ncbi:MAG: oligopeptide/dipeptide ABC transporter ATP-binding protein [Planctomycetota bacterium]|nr:oligopeptide/dipeptide ABC transporter ATP-binding protein [Planctomycetota bacterium]
MPTNDNNTILEVTGLKTYFPVRSGAFGRKRVVRAVDGVDLTVARGRTLGLVGESGSGKTTVGRTLLALIPATAGEVRFDGQEVFSLGRRRLRRLRRRMQIIFQDPYGSLNPRMTVGDIIAEPLAVHRIVPRRRRQRRVGELLERVGLGAEAVRRYPHEFSGGQRQRIGIARALASQPDFIVCDEPVSALDVSIQAQILNLLNDLKDELGLSYLFIAHNLAVVEHFADEVAVMYLGRIVERACRDALYAGPQHPYTEALLSAVPQPTPHAEIHRVQLPGEVPSAIDPPAGCAFHTRCPLTRKLAKDLPQQQRSTILSEGEPVEIVGRCTTDRPQLAATADDPAHCHACLLR